MGENTRFQEIKNLPGYFSSNMLNNDDRGKIYRPLTMLSLFGDYTLFGHNAKTYHAMNIVYHTIAAFLLYFVLRVFWGTQWKSLIAAAFFAVHPVHVDAVGFIINRSEILVLIFLLLSFLVLLRDPNWKKVFTFQNVRLISSQRGSSFKTTFFSSFLFLCALLCKESAAAIVLIFGLFLLIKKWKSSQSMDWEFVFKRISPFVITLFFYLGLRYWALKSFAEDYEVAVFRDLTMEQRFATITRILRDYLFLLVAPVGLKVDYTNYRPSQTILEADAIFSIGLLISILIGCIWGFKRKPELSFLLASVFLALLPVSHFIPIAEVMAERLLYLPSVFFCVWLVHVLLNLNRPRVFMFVSLFFVCTYTALAFDHATNFTSSERLWSEMVKQDPTNPKFQFNLGVTLSKQHRCKEAMLYFKKALEIQPLYVRVFLPLGKCHLLLGNVEGAGKVFSQALKVDPSDASVHRNYAVFHYFYGNKSLGRRHIKIAKEIDPKDPRTDQLLKMMLGN